MHTLLAPSRWRAPAALASVFSIAVAFACSSPTPVMEAGTPGEVCPSNITQATTAGGDGGEGTNSSCHVQGYVCPISWPCSNSLGLRQQALCTCTRQMDMSLSFDCVLAIDNSAVPPNTTDTTSLCQSTETMGDATVNQCPDKTMASTMNLPCSNSGQVCDYIGVKCPGQQVGTTDTCQCVGNANGDAGLSWQCDINSCN
jgi:hypothetical protein